MFSKACEYALKIMIYLAAHQRAGSRVGLKEIAEAVNSPEAFTAKILQQLVRSNLLQSLRGPNGGFQLKENQAVTLSEVVIAIDGEGIFHQCVLGLEQCFESHPCPVHTKFKAVRDHLAGVLISTTIDDVKEGIVQGDYFLKL